MKKAAKISVMAVFLGFIGLFFVLNLVLPSRDFSEQENRYLQQRPAFTFRALFSGSFTEQFEKYTTDQFAFRDTWTTLKARCELLTGKRENKGVYYCDGGTLITRYDAPDDALIAENVSYLNALTEHVDVPVYFALIPGAAEIEAEKLPPNAPTDSQRAVIDAAYALSEAEDIDMLSPLAAHRDEYIFYRTDHHWTSLGAFYGYNALRSAWGMPPADAAAYDRRVVTDSFYGTTYSSSGFSWVAPDEIETFVPDDGSAVVTNYGTAEPQITPLYDTSKLEVKDKYSMFLGGNTPRLVIETGAPGPRLCVIRDSYTDSLIPFLLADFSEIHVLDLRYFQNSVQAYINDGDFDAVLVMYSVPNFSTDTNLFLLAM